MDHDPGNVEKGKSPATNEPPEVTAGAAIPGADQRIQFAPTVRPGRGEYEAIHVFAPASRRHSVSSIPQVISTRENDLRERQQEEERTTKLDEHLLPPQDVAARYKTRISLEKPGESAGLTGQQAEQLLQEYGANILTPPKKKHPLLRYLGYLSSLFNLLLILAGILEYILLAIDFKDNFQNVGAVPRAAESSRKC